MRYVIIGGGIAGTTAAEYLRKNDSDAEITIISEEQHPLYSKVLLSLFVVERVPREKVFLKKGSWYADKNIEYQYGVMVTKIDTKNKFVETIEGREIPYDKLLITTGGDAKLMLGDARGVSYFRNLDDADEILSQVAKIKALPKSERRAVVLGGAFIALEYINLFHHHKIDTTVVMRSDGFWSKIIGKHAKKIVRAHVENSGVKVLSDSGIDELLGDDEFTGVRLKGGAELPAKMLGVGIGLEIDRGLYKDAGIEVEGGVVANEFLETNVENVYTAGDVAEFKDVNIGRTVFAKNWTSAVLQGRVVAGNMMGGHKAYDEVTSYAAELLGLNIIFIGDTSREHADEIVQYVEGNENSIEIFQRDGRTVGAVIIGAVNERQKITNAIKAKENYVA